jgi:ferredoxin--NADP+ reductase
MVVSAIGYKTPPIEGVAYEQDQGRFANDGGVIGEGLYCVGWARRGPHRHDRHQPARRL